LSAQAVLMLASFIATPFVVRLLGSEAYGVLALINILIGYLSFSDIGMGSASTRFGANAYAQKDSNAEVAVIWTSLVIAFLPAVLIAFGLALFSEPLIIHVLRLPAHLLGQAELALRLAALGFVARTVSNVLNTPQLVRLRMDLYSMIFAGAGVAQIFLAPVALLLWGTLSGMVGVITGVSLVTVLVQLIVSRRLLPGLLRPRINPDFAKPLIRFGGALVISSLANLILVNMEKLLVARFVSVTALAHYTIAYTVAYLLASVPGAMIQSLFPAFAQLQAESEREPLGRLYTRALRGNLLWLGPAALLLCVAAKPFFMLWAGPEYGRESPLPFYILVGGLLFNVMAYVPQSLLMGFGRSDLIARLHLAELLPYIVCAVWLTHEFGIAGAALAWSLRVAVDTFLSFRAARHIARFSFLLFPANRLSYALAVASLSLPVFLIAGGVAAPALLIGSTLTSLVIYAALVWMRVLTEEERTWVSSMTQWWLPGLKARL
jgi:O-antigen/teichoic acid export membrane protein